MTSDLIAAEARLPRLAIAVVLALGASLSITAPRVVATPPGDPGLIAIGCEEGLWTIEPNGDNLVQVTDQPTLTPDWSPGGTQIAFIRSDGPTRSSLWIMDADAGAQQRIANPDAMLLDPSWSPDAEFIAYSSDQAFMGRTTRHVRRVRPVPEAFTVAKVANSADNGDPAWSPAGMFGPFAVTVSRPGLFQEIRIRHDGTAAYAMASAPPAGSSDDEADWRPDGDRLAFVRDDGVVRSIHTIDLTGENVLRLTDESLDAISPTYSPDGSTIAFLARPAGDAGTDAPYDLWTMDADGQNQVGVAQDVPCDHVDWQAVPDFPLVDARFSPFESAIRWAFAEGITSGCTPERFCFWHQVTRGQTATFLANAFDLPPTTEDHFSDDDGTTHEDDINRIAEAGLASGCTSSRFCPTRRLSRAEMASLLARALELPSTTTDHFDDDDGRTHEANINRLAEAGFTSGCAPRRYCPDRLITRGESVALLYRAIGQ
jgi:hypothetical protein